MNTLLVTGASGQIGAQIVRALSAHAVHVRAMHRRSPAANMPPGVQLCLGDYGDVVSMAQAFKGVDVAFMYTPQTWDPALWQQARVAGVRHVVLLSSASVVKVPPGSNPVAERHRLAEQQLMASGVGWTIVRPDTLAGNCLEWVESIRRWGEVRVPYPESMRNPIHESDVAALIAQCMLNPAPEGVAFNVTGPRVITISQQVRMLGEVLGQQLPCVQVTEEQAVADMLACGRVGSEAVARRLVAYMHKTVDEPPACTADFERAMGRGPRDFFHWVQDHLADFSPQHNRTQSTDS